MLQTTTVFVNVSKGVLAKHEDLVDVFGTADEEQVCRLILAEGDTQARSRSRPPQAVVRGRKTSPSGVPVHAAQQSVLAAWCAALALGVPGCRQHAVRDTHKARAKDKALHGVHQPHWQVHLLHDLRTAGQ